MKSTTTSGSTITRKETRTTALALMALLGSALLALGCTNPMVLDLDGAANGSRGGIILSVGSGSSGNMPALTVFPGLEMSDIESYRITLTGGPASDVITDVPAEGGGFPSPLELRDIVPGTWTVIVTGYDGGDPGSANPIVQGAKHGVTVVAGASTGVDSIALTYLDSDDPGYLDFAVTWPGDQDVDRVAYRIEALDGTSIAADESRVAPFYEVEVDGETRLSVAIADELELAAGVYWVTVRFDREGDPDDPGDPGASTWVFDELAHIAPNVTTSETVHLDRIPLEVRIANKIDEEIENFVSEDDNFDIDDELGFVYQGTGGGEMVLDTSGIEETVIITFRIRNDYKATGGSGLDSDLAAERFDSGSSVEVSADGSLTGTYYPPYPYDGTDPETDGLIPASDPDNVSLDDLQHVIDNHDGLDEQAYGQLDQDIEKLEGTVITEGEFAGFLEVSFELSASVDEVVFQFGGGQARSYTFGDFSATLP